MTKKTKKAVQTATEIKRAIACGLPRKKLWNSFNRQVDAMSDDECAVLRSHMAKLTR